MHLTVAEIAQRIGGVVEGDGGCKITGVAGIREAVPGDITFIADPRYITDIKNTKASAVIAPPDLDCKVEITFIRIKDPNKVFGQICEWYTPPEVSVSPGIHPTAVIEEGVSLGKDVHIGAHCVLEKGVVVGDRTKIYAGCYLGCKAKVGTDCVFYPHVSLREYVEVGNRTILHNGVVLGSDGFGYSVDKNGVRTKVPQRGIVVVGDDVEIGANTTVDRARFGRTYIGNGVKIDNLVQIAHNVVVNDHAVIVAQVGIAGSCVIGKHAILAGQAGISGHLAIGDGAIVSAQSGVDRDIPANGRVFGTPALPSEKSMRIIANMQRLPAMREKMMAMEKELKDLKSKLL